MGVNVQQHASTYFTPGKTQYPLYRRLDGLRGPVWTGGKTSPTGIRSPARNQWLYLLNYPAHSFHYNQQMDNQYHTSIYDNSVPLYNLHCYVFQYFYVIRQVLYLLLPKLQKLLDCSF